MTTFISKELASARAPARAELTFFGKHPAFADFVQRSDTGFLLKIKQAFLDGVVALRAEAPSLPYRHTFVCVNGEDIIVGVLWDSHDKVNRKDVAGVAAKMQGLAPEAALTNGLPVLADLRLQLLSVSEADEFHAACEAAGQSLVSRIAVADAAALNASACDEEKQRFLNASEFGPENRGWLRILHPLRDRLRGFKARASADALHVRVPLGASSVDLGLGLWTRFLKVAIAPGFQMLIVVRDGEKWIDLLIGEPAPAQFKCLQEPEGAVALATETGYEIDPSLVSILEDTKKVFLGSKQSSAGSRKSLAVVAAIVIGLAIVAAIVFLRFSKGRSSRSQHAASETQAAMGQRPVAAASAAPPVATPTNAIVAAAAITPASVKVQVPNPEFDQAIAQATEAEKAGNFTNAMASYLSAQRINPNDPTVADKIKAILPKAQEQSRKAEEQARSDAAKQMQFDTMVKSAASAIAAGDLTNGIANYQKALAITNDVATRMSLAAARKALDEKTAKGQLTASQFQQALAAATNAEASGNLSAAIDAYKSAQAVHPDDAFLAARISSLSSDLQKQADATAAKAEKDKREEDAFNSAVSDAKAAVDSGSLTGALKSYQRAAELRPDNVEVRRQIEAITAKVDAQTKVSESPDLQKLDSKLEVLMVTFGLLKPDAAKTDEAKHTRLVTGVLSMEDINPYLMTVAKLESDYRTGGWLNSDQRADKLKKLKSTIQTRN
jgi:tetratricopeptide (TPR) repeat protein